MKKPRRGEVFFGHWQKTGDRHHFRKMVSVTGFYQCVILLRPCVPLLLVELRLLALAEPWPDVSAGELLSLPARCAVPPRAECAGCELPVSPAAPESPLAPPCLLLALPVAFSERGVSPLAASLRALRSLVDMLSALVLLACVGCRPTLPGLFFSASMAVWA